MPTLKVFDQSAKSLAAVPGVSVVESYQAFTVIDAKPAAAKLLSERHALVEDISDQYVIRLPRGKINTARPRIDREGKTLAHAGYKSATHLPSGPHHYLVQFIGPVKAGWLRDLRAAGGEVVVPWGGFAFIVRMTPRAVKAVAALRHVRWLGHLPYSARIAAQVRGIKSGEVPHELTPRTRYLAGNYEVQFFTADLALAARTKVRRLGFEVHMEKRSDSVLRIKDKGGAGHTLVKRLQLLSEVHGVSQISPFALRRTSNDRAAVIMGTQYTQGLPAAAAKLGLSGDGEIIGVCDTGIDSGDPATIHPDFKGRILAIKSYPVAASMASDVKNVGADDGAADLDSGHGTHTSGSVLGDGTASAGLSGLAGPVRGLSYKAKLVFQAVEQEVQWKDPANLTDYGRYALAGLPADLTSLFSWAYSQGARIHSNSWGGGDPGAYDASCEQLDRYVWGKPDFCILFAAGNDGADHNKDGMIDLGSVTSPGTAKNCITVGASENNRPNFLLTYGTGWPDDYPKAPIKNDKLADNPDQVAAFSSRGPTADGRAKPDVVSPGTYILSTRSQRLAANQYGYGKYLSSKMYMFDCGTSMATPLTAGAIGLIREYLRKRVKIAKPSAALLKAAVIASAVPLNPKLGIPNNNDGFGRVDLDALLAPAAPMQARFVEGKGLVTGGLEDTAITIKKGGKPLRVVLVYSDYPGAQLVNNLNLIVTGPDGKSYVGNAPKGSSQFDTVNNVESMTITAAAGAWRVRVVGSNIAQGPQPYALVMMGALA